jgi:hypothetical protein
MASEQERANGLHPEGQCSVTRRGPRARSATDLAAEHTADLRTRSCELHRQTRLDSVRPSSRRAPYVHHRTARSGYERSQAGRYGQRGVTSECGIFAGHRLNCLVETGGQGQGRTADLPLFREDVRTLKEVSSPQGVTYRMAHLTQRQVPEATSPARSRPSRSTGRK